MLVMTVIAILILMLQVFLSKKENKWMGLILPALCLVCSMTSTLGILNFEIIKTQSLVSVTDSEKTSEEIMDDLIDHHFSSSPSLRSDALTVFAVSNLPTLLLLAIYISCRNKLHKRLELEKMVLQDLE